MFLPFVISLCVTSILLGSFGGIPAISFNLWVFILSYCFGCLYAFISFGCFWSFSCMILIRCFFVFVPGVLSFVVLCFIGEF